MYELSAAPSARGIGAGWLRPSGTSGSRGRGRPSRG